MRWWLGTSLAWGRDRATLQTLMKASPIARNGTMRLDAPGSGPFAPPLPAKPAARCKRVLCGFGSYGSSCSALNLRLNSAAIPAASGNKEAR